MLIPPPPAWQQLSSLAHVRCAWLHGFRCVCSQDLQSFFCGKFLGGLHPLAIFAYCHLACMLLCKMSRVTEPLPGFEDRMAPWHGSTGEASLEIFPKRGVCIWTVPARPKGNAPSSARVQTRASASNVLRTLLTILFINHYIACAWRHGFKS